MPHTKILPAKEDGDIRHSVSLYLYKTPEELLSLADLDYHSKDFETWRVWMDLQQFWGFADQQGQHIHVWVGNGVSREHIVHLLAHELSHVVLDDAEMDVETRADTVGWIARQALMWADQIKKEKRHGHL